MKKIIIIILVLGFLVLSVGTFYFFNNQNSDKTQDQEVLKATLNISREYATLRYRTDNVLINAENYGDYDTWNNEMTDVINGWKDLEEKALILEGSAEVISTEDEVAFNFIPQAIAYDKQEISKIFDKAPVGKKIATLAKHLGVDAKRAYLILTQDQAQVTADAWNQAGDTLQKLETSATVIKNGSKVTLFVGTIALTGGTAAIATSGTLAQAAIVVSGADLTLEITDDAAKMALGDKNKISSIVGDVRKITEPAAAILMVSTLPNNLVKGVDKLNAVVFGADQLNGTIQAGSVIGIKLPVPTKNESSSNMEVSVMEKEEVNEWMKEQGITNDTVTVEEIEKALGIGEEGEGNGNMKEVDKNASNQSNNKIMSLSELNDLVFNVIQENTSHVKDLFGEPDKIITREDGNFDYIYNGRIKYENGTIGSFTLRFHNSILQGHSASLKNY